jgi:molybdate transport system substrate-binding protein
MLLWNHSLPAQAADIKVIAAIPMNQVMKELGPEFERATGHRLRVQYEVSGVFKRKIEAGESFDVAMSISPVIDELVKEGKIAASSRADFAYAAIGLGVRAGAPKPDIRSIEGFKRTLLNAKSVAHSREGATGVYFKSLLERLGIADEMKSKLKPMAGEALVEAVQRGEAEMVVVTIPGIISSDAELVGPLPSELQHYVAFAVGTGTAAKELDACNALVKFLTAPAAVPTIRAKGMEPGAPK